MFCSSDSDEIGVGVIAPESSRNADISKTKSSARIFSTCIQTDSLRELFVTVVVRNKKTAVLSFYHESCAKRRIFDIKNLTSFSSDP